MKIAYLLIILSVFASCANQTSPTGGPKDEDPPVLVVSNPVNRQLNFNERIIELEFDESIKIRNPKEQIIISPRTNVEYTILPRRKRAILTFDNPLADSTTYTINFREAIVDITESNAPDDLKISFSTSSYLDSLTIEGEVTYLLTAKPAADVSVLLYDTRDTATVLKNPPLYFSKTDDEGNYGFENIRAGSYRVYAIDDKNKDLILDPETETHGFLADTVELDSSLNHIDLAIQRVNPLELQIKNARQNGTIFRINYSKPIKSYALSSSLSDTIFSTFIDAERNSIAIYNTFGEADSIPITISLTDSMQKNYYDSLYIRFGKTVRSPAELTKEVKLQPIFPEDGKLSGQISFNKPIKTFTFDSLYLYLDSLHIIPIDTSEYLQISEHHTTFNLHYTIEKELFSTPAKPATPPVADSIPPPKSVKPHLYIGRGAFISVENDTCDAEQIDLDFDKIDQYGTLLIDITTDKPSYIVQLLNRQFQVVDTVRNISKFAFKKIAANDYYVRVLIDSNNNGVWDAANLIDNQAAEPVLFYVDDNGRSKLIIRSNWELGPLSLEF